MSDSELLRKSLDMVRESRPRPRNGILLPVMAVTSAVLLGFSVGWYSCLEFEVKPQIERTVEIAVNIVAKACEQGTLFKKGAK